MARDPLRYFRIEARELLEQLGQGVLDLEKGSASPDTIAKLLRLAHTLKGAARVVKRLGIAEHAHALEDALAACRDSGAATGRQHIEPLLQRLDAIVAEVMALDPATARPTPDPGSAPDAAGTANAGAAADTGAASEELFRALRPDVHEVDVLLNTLSEAHRQLASLRPLVEHMERATHLADLGLDHFDTPGEREAQGPNDRAGAQRARSLAENLRTTCGAIERQLARRVDAIGREFGEAQGAAERLRLVPASAVFTLLERTARDAAQATGKRVAFHGVGGDIRLDAQLLTVVQAALLQAVRNAVAHGIEPPSERTAAGKPPAGTVTLRVVRRGSRVTFLCEDDGRGIDLPRVRQVAARKGLVGPGTEAPASDELLDLLLRGGISTSGTVTDVSGRGIGMNVVREAAERLGGDVQVKTEAGTGTAVELSLPFALASLPLLRVESQGIPVLLPLDVVRGSLRLSPDMVVRTANGRSVLYEDRSLPLGMLGQVLVPGTAPAPVSGPMSVVVVEGRRSAAAIGVDRVLGTTTAVVRPLPDLAPAASCVAGASLDEKGVPQLVLDPDALIEAIERWLGGAPEPASSRLPILVVDDSLTTRMLEQSILESAGYEVELATSGEEALEKAGTTRYGLFLVDVEMPGMDGFTFVERTRAEPSLRDVPAILVTSRNAPEDLRRGREAGAIAYIVKSEFDQGVLLDRIKELVG